jgi:hypothetical protein
MERGIHQHRDQHRQRYRYQRQKEFSHRRRSIKNEAPESLRGPMRTKGTSALVSLTQLNGKFQETFQSLKCDRNDFWRGDL